MNLSKDVRLFFIEFGPPDTAVSVRWTNDRPDPVYVIAKTYDEAAEKALVHAGMKRETQSIINNEVDLNLNNREEIKIKSIRLAAEEILF